MKKNLNKFLPSEAMISDEQQEKPENNNNTNKNGGKESSLSSFEKTMKMCRLYLRVKCFLINIDNLSGRTLYYYYEQTRLDSLKYQNWLQLTGYTEVFISIAAKTIWLKYAQKWKDMLKDKKIALNIYLPEIDKTIDKWALLEEKLLELDSEYIVDKNGEREILHKSDSTVPLQIITVEIVNENEVIGVKETIMTSVIKDILKLPYYGVHYYHVTKQVECGNNLTHCKLGIGPFGVTVVVSPYFTTWTETLNMSWTSAETIQHNNNVLEIIEFNRGTAEREHHFFNCLNEKEAKYLVRELKEIMAFQSQMKISQKTKRNSIGIMNKDEKNGSSMLYSPVPRRSSSFSLLNLALPRKMSSGST